MGDGIMRWEKDGEETTTLEVDQMVRGTYLGFNRNEEYQKNYYKIEVTKGRPPIVLKGCTVLDRIFQNKKPGDLVGIKRLPDKQGKKATPYRNYESYHPVEEKGEETQ